MKLFDQTLNVHIAEIRSFLMCLFGFGFLNAVALSNYLPSSIAGLLPFTGIGSAQLVGLYLIWAAACRYSAKGGAAGHLLRAAAQSGKCKGKVVIVTGCNTGIGYYTALNLASIGCTVVITTRTEKMSKTAANQMRQELAARGVSEKSVNIVDDMFLTLDDFDSVRAFAADFQKRFKQLDILVNNAGMANKNKPTQYSKNAPKYEVHTAINVLGPILLTELLLPMLKKCNGRVVNVASLAHNFPAKEGIKPEDVFEGMVDMNQGEGKSSGKLFNISPFPGLYGASKLMNVHYSTYLAAKCGVTSTSLHPGTVGTNFGANLVGALVWGIVKQFLLVTAKTSEEGAQTSLYCCLCPERELAPVESRLPSCAGTSMSSYFCDCKQMNYSMDDCAHDSVTAVKVSEWAKKELGV